MEVSPPPAAAGIAGNRHLKVAGRVLPIKEEKTIRKQGWNKKVAWETKENGPPTSHRRVATVRRPCRRKTWRKRRGWVWGRVDRPSFTAQWVTHVILHWRMGAWRWRVEEKKVRRKRARRGRKWVEGGGGGRFYEERKGRVCLVEWNEEGLW